MSEQVTQSSINTRAKAKEFLLNKKGVTANILAISDEQMAIYLCDHMNAEGRLALVPAKGVDGALDGTKMFCPICRQVMDMSIVNTVELARAKDTLLNVIQQVKSLSNLSENSALSFAHTMHLIKQIETVYRQSLTVTPSNKGFTDFKNGKFNKTNGSDNVGRFIGKYTRQPK